MAWFLHTTGAASLVIDAGGVPSTRHWYLAYYVLLTPMPLMHGTSGVFETRH
jgi:hypothetical protein